MGKSDTQNLYSVESLKRKGPGSSFPALTILELVAGGCNAPTPLSLCCRSAMVLSTI